LQRAGLDPVLVWLDAHGDFNTWETPPSGFIGGMPMSYRAPGGPSATVERSLFRTLAQTERIVAVSVSTWNPELDPDGRTRAVCMELLESLTSHLG
jgi:arginase family enzyme